MFRRSLSRLALMLCVIGCSDDSAKDAPRSAVSPDMASTRIDASHDSIDAPPPSEDASPVEMTRPSDRGVQTLDAMTGSENERPTDSGPSDTTASAVDSRDPRDASRSAMGPDVTTPNVPDVDWSGRQGALVTRDCLYRSYPYAIDIRLSCGAERFDQVLRLHTFKRHAHQHRSVFSDQRITVRDRKLWFDGYPSRRCIQVNARGELILSMRAGRCAEFDLVQAGESVRIRDFSTGLCAGLGDASCDDHQFTGGLECGGVEHRYLPLVMGDCRDALQFSFAGSVDFCDGELPEDACF